MKGKIGLPPKAAKEIVKRLSILLGDIHQLYIKSLGYHWNVEDPRFLQLHELFEQGYQELAGDLDIIAERIRKLGEPAPQSIKELTSLSRLKDTQKVKGGDQMIDTLATDYESLLVWLRKDIDAIAKLDDHGTVDTLTGLLRQYEKRVWFLRSHL